MVIKTMALDRLAEILKSIDDVLRPNGFRRKGKRSWVLSTPEVVQEIRLGKSQWGDKYWLECFLSFPKAENDQIEMKIDVEELIPDRKEYSKIMDLTQDIPDLDSSGITTTVRQCLATYVIPRLKRILTEADAATAYVEKRDRAEIFTNLKTAEYLGLLKFYQAENEEIARRKTVRESAALRGEGSDGEQA
jgi:hypothetical protein